MADEKKKVDCTELAAALSKLAETVMRREETRDYDGVVAHVQKLFPEVTRAELTDAILTARAARSAEKRGGVQSRIANIKNEARQESAVRRTIERLEKQIASGHFDAAEGVGREDHPLSNLGGKAREARGSATLRTLRKQAERLRREAGIRADIEETKAELARREAGEENLAQRRGDAEREQEGETRAETRRRGEEEKDPEIEALMKERDELKRKLGEPARVEKQIEALNRKIEEAKSGKSAARGDAEKSEGRRAKSETEKNPAVEALEKELSEARRQTAERARAEKRLKELEEEVGRLRAGEEPKGEGRRAKGETEKDQRVVDLMKERDELKRKLGEPRRLATRIEALKKRIEDVKAGRATELKTRAQKDERIAGLEKELAAAVKEQGEPARIERRAQELERQVAEIRAGKEPEGREEKTKPAILEVLEQERNELLAAQRSMRTLDEQIAVYEAGGRPEARKRGEAGHRAATPEEAAKQERRNTLKHKADLADEIDRLTEALTEGPLPEPEFKLPRAVEDEILRQEIKVGKLRQAVKARLAEMRPREGWEVFRDKANAVHGLMRSLQTSFDLSAPLRQGGFIVMAHPARAARSFMPMLRAFTSKEAALRVRKEIEARGNWPVYIKSGLELTDWDGPLLEREESFQSQLAEKVPFKIGKGVQASQRAYTTFLNKLRADSFNAMVESLGGSATAKELEAIARFINIATGRGGRREWAPALQAANVALYSARFQLSRIQMLYLHPFWFAGSGRVRWMIAQEYLRYLAGFAVLAGLTLLMGGEIETDPRSSNWAKFRFEDMSVDMGVGMQQQSVAATRLFLAAGFKSGQYKNTRGEVYPIRGADKPFNKTDWLDVLARFGRSKAAPGVGSVIDAFSGDDYLGNKTTVGGVALKSVTPMNLRNAPELLSQGPIKGGAGFILSTLGAGVSVDEDTLPAAVRKLNEESSRLETEVRRKKRLEKEGRWSEAAKIRWSEVRLAELRQAGRRIEKAEKAMETTDDARQKERFKQEMAAIARGVLAGR